MNGQLEEDKKIFKGPRVSLGEEKSNGCKGIVFSLLIEPVQAAYLHVKVTSAQSSGAI